MDPTTDIFGGWFGITDQRLSGIVQILALGLVLLYGAWCAHPSYRSVFIGVSCVNFVAQMVIAQDGPGFIAGALVLPIYAAIATWLGGIGRRVVLALTGRRDRRRLDWMRLGACAECGYDLTGNVSGVCPECGHSTEARDT